MQLPLLPIFLTSFMVALSGALMPGPLLTVTISESTRRGPLAGPLMIFGHIILEIILVTCLISGLAPFLVRDDVFIFISYGGGAVLLYMGISMLRSTAGLSLSVTASSSRSNNLIVAGIVLSAVNPYFLIWWGSIGTGYIIHSLQFGLLGVAAFFLGHMFADLLWYAFVSFSIARGRRLLSDTIYRRLIGCCGLFLIGFSCWFFYSGARKMLAYASA